MKRFTAIDSLRAIAALLIISHHVGYESSPDIFPIFSKITGTWALPFFLTISGFFLGYKDNLMERSMKTVSRLLWVFIIWSIIYFPIRIYRYGIGGGIINVINFVYVQNTHFWFLIALIIGILVLNFFEYFKLHRYKIPFSILLLTLFYLNRTAYGPLVDEWLHLPFEYPLFALAIPCIFFGYYLAKLGQPQFNIKHSYMLIAIGLILSTLEGYFIGVTLRFIGTIPFLIGVVNLGLNNPKYLNIPTLTILGGRYGLGIYLLHPLIIFGLYRLNLSLFENPIGNILFPVVVFLLSAIILHAIFSRFPKLYKLLTGNFKKTTIAKPILSKPELLHQTQKF